MNSKEERDIVFYPKKETTGQRPLTELVDSKLLDALGLPTNDEPTVLYTGRQPAIQEEHVHYYIGNKELKPSGQFTGGFPVIIYEKEKNNWYVNGIEGEDREVCSPASEQQLFDRAVELIDPKNLVSSFSLEILVADLAAQLK